MQWRGPLFLSKRAELDVVFGPEVEFPFGMRGETEILTIALTDWLREVQEIGDVQQAEIRNREWGSVLSDGTVWLPKS